MQRHDTMGHDTMGHDTMGIGAGIFLLAVGAILAFAVQQTVNGIDIQTVGVILMIAGALGIVLELIVFAPRRRHVTYGDQVPPVRRTTRSDDEIY